MSNKNGNVLTQIEGQHRVAAELCARGYLPAILPERCFQCDALVLAPSGRSFGVEVKANRVRGSWWCKRPPDDCPTLLWIFVVLQPATMFYILTKAQVQTEYDVYQDAAPRKATDHGFSAQQLDAYAARWEHLPE